MAGTTVHDNNYVGKIFVNAFAEFGISISIEEANAVMGYEKKRAIGVLLRKRFKGKTDKKLITKIHQYFIRLCIAFYKDRAKPKSHAVQLFKKLQKANIKIALNSGFDRSIMDCIIARLKWYDYVDYTVASDEVKKGRPMPLMIRKIMKQAKIKDATSVAKVGDTPVDLLEGFHAGTGLNIAIESNKYTNDILSIYPHTHILKNLKEVFYLLESESI